MKVLFISNLYPDQAEPGRGLPNARLVRRLAKHCEIRVIAPRPVLPFMPSRRRRPLPDDEEVHPQFPSAWYLPKIGSRWNPWLMRRSLEPVIQRLRGRWPFELVVSAWLYPDACAAQPIAASYATPLIAIAQGSDVHQYLQHPIRRRLMQLHLSRCRYLVARSKNLAQTLEQAGFDPARLRVIYNGVDTTIFHPGDSRAARQRLSLTQDAHILLWVGNLLPVKNPLLAVEAARLIQRRHTDPFYLVMLGDGPLGPQVAERARQWRVPLILAGRRSEKDTADFMRAADALCLTSHAEGTPNVVLEALACGLPVAATAVGGLPEIVQVPVAGQLVPPADAPALAEAVLKLWGEKHSPEVIAETVQSFSWERTVEKYLAIFSEVMVGRTAAS